MPEQLQALLAGLLIMVIGYYGYHLIFLSKEDVQLIVNTVQGTVVRTDAAGAQEAALGGMALYPHDALIVGEASTAELFIGEDSRLTLEALSSIRVVAVEETGIRVELEEGRVSAKVRPSSPALSISNRGRAVTADDAAFRVNAALDGALSLAVDRGELELSGFDAQETLSMGAMLSAVPGESPVLRQIPDEILLEVHWPELATTREEEVYVEGRTAPYADIRLTVRDELQHLRAQADGSFRIPIYMIEGDNLVHVAAQDGVGNRIERSREFQRITTPPLLNIEVQWPQR